MAIDALAFKRSHAAFPRDLLPCHAAVSLYSYDRLRESRIHRDDTRDFMIDQQLDIPTRDGQTTTFATYRRNLASPAA
jgi:hypothetical protein